MQLGAKTVRFKCGEVIYSPFSRNREVFIIERGYVMAFTYEDTGKRRIHIMYGPGAYFPVITAFKNKDQRATYEGLTDVEVACYTKSKFTELIDQDPNFCKQILVKTVDQLTIFANRVVELQATKLEDRLLAKLTTLLDEHGIVAPHGRRLPYKLTHNHLADLLGVERESITRAYNRLRKKQIIQEDSEGSILVKYR